MKRFIYICLLAICSTTIAQEKIITGIVIDAHNAEVLPFTNIGFIGKTEGTIANSEGHFTLSTKRTNKRDSIFFSYIGYDPIRVSIKDATEKDTFKLTKRAVQLTDFSVGSRELTPLEIINELKANYNKNHAVSYQKYRIFSREASYNKIHENKMKFKGSTFEAIDQNFIDQINDRLPENLNFYNDVLYDVVYSDKDKKMLPIEGQSLYENWNFDEEFDKNITMLANDLESDVRDKDSYFKLRSGIFGSKLDFGNDTSFTITDDSTKIIMSTYVASREFNYLVKHYSTIHSKRFDFFREYEWYNYKLKDIAIVNDELCYVIDFKPEKRKGKYKGTICVSTSTFALIQLDYAFAPGKKGKGISALGVEYKIANRSGRAIFEKGSKGYYLKYLARESDERFGVDRTLTIKRKKEDGLIDKTLQAVKVKVDMKVTFEQKKELLVINQEDITPEQYNAAQQPETMEVYKVHKYDSDIWKNSSIIEPTKALKEYEQQY